MSNDEVERLAKLLHETYRRRYRDRCLARAESDDSKPWEHMPLYKQDDYRFAVRVIAKELGSRQGTA